MMAYSEGVDENASIPDNIYYGKIMENRGE